MDQKRLILAVAGSGKTSFLINQLDEERRFLIVTYTLNNTDHIRESIIRKFSYFPKNIHLFSYFQFLIRICLNPFFYDYFSANGILFKSIPTDLSKRYKDSDKRYYITNSGHLYHNRIAKKCQEITPQIAERIDKYYDCFFFDEIQDLAGHDFDLVTKIIPPNAEVLFVGDFYQHTFDTSRDGTTNKSLYGSFDGYLKKWKPTKIEINQTILSNSFRCTPTVCLFVKDNLGIEIYSHRIEHSTILLVENQDQADRLFADNSIPKLFLRDCSKYPCSSLNWGASKGLDDFTDIAIVLNKESYQSYINGKLRDLSPVTKNKLYVACTRARRDIYLIPYSFMEKYKRN